RYDENAVLAEQRVDSRALRPSPPSRSEVVRRRHGVAHLDNRAKAGLELAPLLPAVGQALRELGRGHREPGPAAVLAGRGVDALHGDAEVTRDDCARVVESRRD